MNINAKSVGIVLACLISVTLVNIWVWSVWNHSFISNDGVQYLSTTQNWLDGNGLTTDALIFAPHFQGVLPAPQTVWPPGYIFVVGLTTMLGLSLESTAFLVGLICQALSAVLVMFILMRFGLNFIFFSLQRNGFLFYRNPLVLLLCDSY